MLSPKKHKLGLCISLAIAKYVVFIYWELSVECEGKITKHQGTVLIEPVTASRFFSFGPMRDLIDLPWPIRATLSFLSFNWSN